MKKEQIIALFFTLVLLTSSCAAIKRKKCDCPKFSDKLPVELEHIEYTDC